jgi:hypothetical protein
MTTFKAESLDDIRGAINEQIRPGSDDDPWVWELFIEPLEAIISEGEQYFRASVTMEDDEPVIVDRSEWIEVERVWIEKSMGRSAAMATPESAAKSALDLLVYQGGAIKALGDGRVGGHLVLFSTANDPDLEGEFFTKETDFDLLDDEGITSVYFQHGLDPVLKNTRLGRGTLALDDVGVWIDAQLELRDDYERAVYSLVEQEKMGWSSGTAPSLIAREPAGKSTWIKNWPLGLDGSLTPIPAEPRLLAMPLKMFAKSISVDLHAAVQALLEDAGDASAEDVLSKKRIAVTSILAAAKIKQGG